MPSDSVALLGAGGTLGRRVRAELEARGRTVVAVPRADARSADAIAAHVTAAGAGAIVDCAGASVALGLGRGWRGFSAVDTPIGVAAATAARRTGARMVYVATHFAPAQRATPYVAAHERVVAAMRDVPGAVVRATGFFAAFGMLAGVARSGWLADVGAGRARTNPIDERDLAELVAEQVLVARPGAPGDPAREIAAGGPETFTRGELFALVARAAAAAARRRVRIVRVPTALAWLGATCLSALHPRIGQFGRFACGLARHDVVAPALGTRRLSAYLPAYLSASPSAPPAAHFT